MPQSPPLRQAGVHLEWLHRSPALSLSRSRCRDPHRGLGPEEAAPEHLIVFVQAGLFERVWGSRRLLADASHVLFFNAGEPYQVAHPGGRGDDCLVVALPPADLVDVLAPHDPGVVDRAQPFREGHALASPRAALLQRRLTTRAQTDPDPLALAEAALELAADVTRPAAGGGAPDHLAARRPDTRRRHREIVEQAKLELNQRVAEGLTLAGLARAVHCAPFHLARLFRRETGLSLHAYLTRLRLRLAVERLADGARDLSALALQLGFSHHSHLANAFRREYGLPPSRFRSDLAGRSRAIRKILQA